MTRLVAILVTLVLVAIPAKADVALWPRPVPGWTVIQVYGVITPHDPPNFERYTENVDPAATLDRCAALPQPRASEGLLQQVY